MTEPEIQAAAVRQAIFGGLTPDNPVPEKKETIEAQMRWLVAGRKAAVFLPPGSFTPELPKGYARIETEIGVFYYNPLMLDPLQIDAASELGKIGLILGYGVEEKPALVDVIGAVVIRDSTGYEKLSIAVSQETFSRAIAAALKLSDSGDKIQFENPADLVAQRKL